MRNYHLAQLAYYAYHKSFDEKPIPFDDLPVAAKDRWWEAAQAVRIDVLNRPM